MSRFQIAPGVHVTELAGDKFKRCKISIYMALPGRRETATALAILPNLLSRSCEDIPDALMLSRRLFEMYGADLSATSFQAGANRVVALGISGIKNAYALEGEDLEGEYLSLLCTLLFAPKLAGGVFDPADVDVEKTKQADFLKSEMNDKRSYCLRQARRKLFGDSPHGLESAGYLADIEALTPADIFACYRELLQKAQFEVMVCGADGQKAGEMVVKQLAAISRAPLVLSAAEAVGIWPQQQDYKEPMDTAQGKLCLLFSSGRLPDPAETAAMRMATLALGALPTSRLFMNVREKQSLCYYCACSYSGYSGTLCIDSGIDHANAQKAAAAIVKELHTLQNEPISEEEMDNARRALRNSFTAAADSPDALESWTINERLRGSGTSLEEAAALAEKVTREEIRAALAQFRPAVEYTLTQKEAEA